MEFRGVPAVSPILRSEVREPGVDRWREGKASLTGGGEEKTQVTSHLGGIGNRWAVSS